MKKTLALLLVLCLVFALAMPAALAEEPEEGYVSELVDGQYVPAEDDEIYEANLGEYEALCEAAKAAETNDERFVLYAQAEAYLLDSAVMQPNTTQGGAYTISRIAPRTVPYVQWGNDDDRLFGLVISDEFLTPEERADCHHRLAEHLFPVRY